MADYQRLLKRAIDSLTDNNGANRRQIYEKARTALVSQLRAVEPPLSASEITQHRLSLEDCIHEVEQNAIRVLMDGMRPSPVSARDDEDDISPVVAETVEAEEVEPEEVAEVEAETEEVEAEETESEDDAAEAEDSKPEDSKSDENESDADESDDIDGDDSEADEAETTEPDSAETETQEELDEDVEDEPVAQDEANDESEPDETASDDEENDASEDSSTEADDEEPTDAESADDDAAEDADVVDDASDEPAETSDDDSDSDSDDEGNADQRDDEANEEGDSSDADDDEPDETSEKSDEADADTDVADSSEDDSPKDVADSDDAETEESDDAGDESEETDGVADPSADAADDVADEVQSTDTDAEEDPQIAIDRAIAKLTRQDVELAPEIKSDFADVPDVEIGESETADSAGSESAAVELPEELNVFETSTPVGVDQALDDAIDSVSVGVHSVSGSDSFEGAEAQIAPKKPFGALRILFFTIILLLAIFAGAVYWAWNTGRVDLTTVFDRVSVWRTSITQMIAGDEPESDVVPVAEIETPAETDTEVSDPAPNSENDPEVVIENGAETDAPETEQEQETEPETGLEIAPDPTEGAVEETEPVSNVRVVDAEPDETAPEADVQTESDTETSDTPATDTEAETETADVTSTQKSEERLPSGDTTAQTGEPAVNADGTVSEVATPDVSQSILLEEQPSGSTGGLPFSGNVVWDRTVDSAGVPAIRARAKIPARNISLDLIIRKNFDTQLPASHVMEINFSVQPTFAGGGVANVPGILMKNEELTQGKALIGASARVLDNSFLVALSQADADLTHNLALLAGEEWIDVPMVYSTGKRAIMTLEKGADGAAVFAEVMAEWLQTE